MPTSSGTRDYRRFDELDEEDAWGGTSLPPVVAQPLSRIGDYRILREIGRDGMGVVYETEQVGLSRRRALKVLPHEIAHPSIQRFSRGKRPCRSAARRTRTGL